MTSEEYELTIGKLVILKLFLTERHRSAVDEVIEGLEEEYLRRRREFEL